MILSVVAGSGTSLPTQTDSLGSRQAVSTAASKYVLNSKASDDASTKSSEHTTETAEQNNDCIIVAAAHGDTSTNGGSSSGSSNHNDGVAVVAPTAVVTAQSCTPTRVTDLKSNGFVVHNDDCSEVEMNGDLVDSSSDVIKQNGVPHLAPHPPTSPKPERRFSPRDKRDVTIVSDHIPVAIVTNGASKTVTDNVDGFTPGDECVNHEAGHVGDGSGEVAPLELTNTMRTAPVIAREETTCKVGLLNLNYNPMWIIYLGDNVLSACRPKYLLPDLRRFFTFCLLQSIFFVNLLLVTA